MKPDACSGRGSRSLAGFTKLVRAYPSSISFSIKEHTFNDICSIKKNLPTPLEVPGNATETAHDF